MRRQKICCLGAVAVECLRLPCLLSIFRDLTDFLESSDWPRVSLREPSSAPLLISPPAAERDRPESGLYLVANFLESRCASDDDGPYFSSDCVGSRKCKSDILALNATSTLLCSRSMNFCAILMSLSSFAYCLPIGSFEPCRNPPKNIEFDGDSRKFMLVLTPRDLACDFARLRPSAWVSKKFLDRRLVLSNALL